MSLDFYLQYEIDGNNIIVFDRNITHNLNKMAVAAGVYEALWRPELKSWTVAKEITPVLRIALQKLKKYPKRYEKFDSENGWGTYEHFVPFVEGVLAACEKYPTAKIKVSR